MALVKDHGRDRMNALLEVEALALADLRGVPVRSEYLARPRTVQTRLGGEVHQYLVIAGILASREVCGEKRMLESLLPALKLGPMQQPVRIEGVVDPPVLTPPSLRVLSLPCASGVLGSAELARTEARSR
jgi:hypothetical protein